MTLADEDDNIVEVFSSQRDPVPDFRNAVAKASEMLFGSAIGFHMELVEGYGKKIRQWRAEQAAENAGPTIPNPSESPAW
jgi:hypothetical protein